MEGHNSRVRASHGVVERDRLRERERQARAQMSAQAEREAEPQGAPVFGAPVRVTPSAGDRVTQQIQSYLGNYDRVKQLLEDQPKLLIGITGSGGTAAAVAAAAGAAASRPPPPGEFKKPASHYGGGGNGRVAAHHQQSVPRGGFVKPADGKPPYGGRGGYPGQPVKHGGGSNDHRSNGIVPAKGPPLPASSSSVTAGNRIHQASKNLPRLHVDQGLTAREDRDQVENILKEMSHVATPLSGIATPRKETETKFTFHPEFPEPRPTQPPPPPPAAAAAPATSDTRTHRSAPTPTTQHHHQPATTLLNDLSLSEDSDDEKDECKASAKISSPPARMDHNTQVIALSPPASSSSDSDSGSETESSSASEAAAVVAPVAVSPLPPEEEAKPRWNLGSFLKKPPDEVKSSPIREAAGDSDDSNKDLHIVQEALLKPEPLLSSLSESDADCKKPAASVRRQRKSAAARDAAAARDSDSDAHKPAKRSYVRKSRSEDDPRGKRKPYRKRPGTPSGSEDETVKKPKPKRPPPPPEEEKRKRPRGRPPKEPKVIVDSSDDEWKVKVTKRREDDKKKDKVRTSRPSKKLELKIKSKERCPTPTSDSDSDVAPPKVRHSSPESVWHSDSDSEPPKEESPPKLDTECKAIQDKKKNHTLHKIFSNSLKRDQEGGKGGAKGGYGGKGKGKGGSKTPGIIVDSESERTSNDISSRLLSPPSNNDSKYSPGVKVKRETVSDTEKPPSVRVKVEEGVLSLMCRLDLSRLSYIPSKCRSSEEVRTRTELADTRQRGKRPRSPERVIPKCDKKQKSSKDRESSSKREKHVHRRNRQRSSSSMSSLSTECSRKRPASSQASGPYMEHVLTEPALTDAPPTNHERQELHFLPSADWQAPQQVYFSYFERGPESVRDSEDRAQDQFLSEAKRLKHQADRETDPMAQAMMYLEAVIFFVLTGNAIEAENSMEKTPFTMYRETLGLIKFISSKFENQHSSSPESIDTKLQVLSLRCQSLLHLKLYKMKKQEIKDIQKQLEDFAKKSSHASSMQPGEACGGQGTPSALSPTPSPAGSVGSVGSQSSGYNSGELRGQQQAATTAAGTVGPCIAVPLAIYTAMHKQTENFASILSCHELWDEADALVYKGKHLDFFIDLDRYFGPLTLHSSLIDLVRYVREGIQRLKDMSPRSHL